MRILLDTHFLLWLTLDTSKLRPAERALIGQGDIEIVCSTVSLWELRLKWHSIDVRGARKGPIDPEQVLSIISGRDWPLLSLEPRHAVAPLEYPLAHGDPFDELLLVQAQVEGLQLMTRDRKLRAHPLAYHLEPGVEV